MLGNDQNSFQTQNAAAYKNIPGEKYHAHKQANTSNIDLGSGHKCYDSENKQHFFNKNAEREVVEK